MRQFRTLDIFLVTAMLTGFPQGSIAQGIDTQLVTSLKDYLGYGVIGLGLGLAVLAAILLAINTERSLYAGTRFMLFGLALVVIGAALEVVKTWAETREAERKLLLSLNLPDEFWQDFLIARKQALFGTAEPTDEFASGVMRQGESRSMAIYLPPSECRFYFVAAKPPARTSVSIRGTTADHQLMRNKEYYQTGKICSVNDTEPLSMPLELQMQEADSQFSISAYIAPPNRIVARNESVSPAVSSSQALKKVVCTGQYEANCTGPHDVFIQCGAPPDEQIAAQICTSLGRPNGKALRINTKGGNRCGYALTEVICD